MGISKRWGVGIVGAGGWGGIAHVPALANMDTYEARAVTGTSPESAKAAAKRHGILNYYTDALEMAKQIDIDIVTVTVKVPEHDQLIRRAIEAGKHVFCEWPLARNTEEAEDLLALAQEKGVEQIVGLQARGNPVVRYIRELVMNHILGRVLAVNAVVTLPGFPTIRGTVDLAHRYLLEKSNGADQLTIGAGHVLDAVEFMVAPFTEVAATLATQYPEVNVLETGETVIANAPDHVLVSGKLKQGALVSAQFINGGSPGFTIRIIGTEGELAISPRDGLMFQMDRLIVQWTRPTGELEIIEAPEDDASKLDSRILTGPEYNVAHLYNIFAERLGGAERALPDFSQAVGLHRLMDAIRTASLTGLRQAIT